MNALGFACILVLLVGCIELAAWWLVRSLGYVATKEFPPVSPELIEKFTSFDSQLGHLPLPCSTSFDRDITGKAYSTQCSYNADRARMSKFSASEPAIASTFGDSFCQCRGVQDDETWQRYMEESLGRPVRNYGVGGHGLDQAYLRYLRIRHEPLGKFIVFAVSACTIERLIGIYKHYVEFGNVLGVKPRFTLNKDGGLDLVRLPIDMASGLANMSDHRSFLHECDENHEGFFRQYSARAPYSLFLARNRSDLSQAITGLCLRALDGKLPWRAWFEARHAANVERSRQIAYARKNVYFSTLFRMHEELFVQLARSIGEECAKDGRRAVLLMLPDYTNISFMKVHGHYYRVLWKRISRDGLQVIDSYDVFQKADPKRSYLKENSSGHHTARGNAVIAELVLSANIFGTTK